MNFLVDSFEDQVVCSPLSTALILENGTSFSYQHLNEIASCLSKELACALEVTNQDIECEGTPLVAVMMTRGLGFVSAVLAILKAGGAYVPVDPAFPPDRQAYIFAHSKCQLLITDEESLKLALSFNVAVPPTFVLDDGLTDRTDLISRCLNLPTFENLDKDAILMKARGRVMDREDGGLAYVLYTSGSTGKPKGVMVKQAGVVNIVNWFADELRIGSHSRVLGKFCSVIFYLSFIYLLF